MRLKLYLCACSAVALLSASAATAQNDPALRQDARRDSQQIKQANTEKRENVGAVDQQREHVNRDLAGGRQQSKDLRRDHGMLVNGGDQYRNDMRAAKHATGAARRHDLAEARQARGEIRRARTDRRQNLTALGHYKRNLHANVHQIHGGTAAAIHENRVATAAKRDLGADQAALRN